MAIPVPITGEVLRWAMVEAGLSRQQLAKNLHVSAGTIEAWEEEVEEPTTSQFQELSRTLGRPASFFLLPRPPAQKPIVAAFRRAAGADDHLKPDEIRAVRRAKKIAQVVGWIRSASPHAPKVDVPRAQQDAPPSEVAESLRKWLRWPVDSYVGQGLTEATTRNYVRFSIQERGVLALHLSIADSEIRGFALPDSTAPVVAINTTDSGGARLYSYGHELAHLTLKDRAVCHTRVNRGIEQWCNKVSAALFMPAAEFRSTVSRRIGVQRVEDISQVRNLANFYHLSLRAVARRLEDLDLATEGLYIHIDRLTENKKSGGRSDDERPRTRPRIKVQQLGRAYGTALIEAENAGLLSSNQIFELVGLSPSEFQQYREILLAGDEG